MVCIELSKFGKKYAGKYISLLSDADADLANIDWSVIIRKCSKTVYAHRKMSKTNRSIYLHDIVAERCLGPKPKGMTVDHINRKGWDNRRENIRYASQTEQKYNLDVRADNASGQTGVYWFKPHRKWKARCFVDGKEIHLGYFDKKSDAIRARLNAERKHYELV